MRSRFRFSLGLPPTIVPLFWGMLFLEATFGAYLSVWPLWIEALGAPLAVVGLVLGAGGFVRLLVIGPSAAIADRVGYRRAIIGCRLATAAGLLVAAFATHWTQLLLTVVGAAIGELVFPLVMSIAAAQAGEQRLRVFAIVFTVGPSIALIVSPLISGGLVALFGIRAAFVFGAACTLVSLIFMRRIEEPPGLRHHPDKPISTYRDTVADTGVRLVALLLLAVIFSLALGTSFVPTFLEDVRGLTPATIATMSAASAVGSATIGLAVARIRRLQRIPFIAVAVGVGVTACGFVIFGTATALPVLVLGFYCRGGMFSAWAMLNAALGELAPAAHRTRAFALCEMCGGIAYSLGPVVAGPLYVRGATLPFAVATVLALVLIPVLVVAQRYARGLRIEQASLPLTSVGGP